MRKIKKKGQEEIVGFVVIVVLVAVIFLVILGLYIRQKAPVTQKESKDVEQFLGSVMEYTSDCSTGEPPRYFSLGQLVRECYDHTGCDGIDDDSCGVLNRTLQEVIDANWKIGPENPSKGYIFNSTYHPSSGSGTDGVLFMEAGNCTGERIGAEHLSPVPPSGSIISSLVICS